MLVCCHGTYLCGEAGGKALLQQGPLGKRKQKWQCQDIPGYMPSRNSPAPSYQQFSCLLSNPARGGRSQGVQARTCQPTGNFWATFLGCKLGPWGLGSCRALGETGQTCSRHGAKLEEVRPSFVSKEEEDSLYTDVAVAPLQVAMCGSTMGDGIIRVLLASPSSSMPIASVEGKIFGQKIGTMPPHSQADTNQADKNRRHMWAVPLQPCVFPEVHPGLGKLDVKSLHLHQPLVK